MALEKDVARYVTNVLKAEAVPENVAPMQAYLKTDMPFYGVKRKPMDAALKPLKRAPYKPDSPESYRAAVRALWTLPHREEKYAAIRYARFHQDKHDVDNLELFIEMVRAGAWWDFVDEIAAHLIGGVLLAERDTAKPIFEKWIRDEDMWVRRAAVLAQLRHKANTDEAQLFAHCARLLHEKPFFIRKAVGWALRDYSRTAPESVSAFIAEHRDQMSPLTLREAGRLLAK